MRERFTQQSRWGRGPLGVKGPTVTRSTGVDAWGMRPTISGAIFEHGWYCSLFIHDLYCMICREVCIYGKFDISIYTLKREIRCLLPLWNIVIFIMFSTFLAPNLCTICECGSVKPLFTNILQKKTTTSSYRLFCYTVLESLVLIPKETNTSTLLHYQSWRLLCMNIQNSQRNIFDNC